MAGVPLLFATCLMSAQSGAGLTPTLYDMSGFYNTELNGTARYVGMGGAMNALGGDISLMNTNAAGIGLYRKNDVAITGGVGVFKNDMGAFGSEKETRGTFNQAGFVYSNHVDGPVLKYFNLGFNYHKLNNFNGKMSWNGHMPSYQDGDYKHTASQTTLMADQANGMGKGAVTLDTYNSIKNASSANDFYQNSVDLGWLTIMGIRTGLITTLTDANGNLLTNSKGDPVYGGFDGGTGNYYSETRGGIDSYDFNMAFNLNDRVYLGVTLSAFDVNYDYYSRYSEDLYDAYATNPNATIGHYVLENWKKTTGNGFNLNFGAIFRPIEDSPFRFGVAIKTPTWYRLTDTYSTALRTDFSQGGGIYGAQVTNEQTGLSYDYRYQTPWSFNLSLGHTIGDFLALDAEYEYTDYTTAKLKDADGINADENAYIKDQLKAVNQFKIGAEWKPASDFAIRLGYNYLSNVMKTGDAYNYTPGYNSVNTRTEYANMKDGYNVTFGMGYSGSHFYADLAYLYSRRNYDFTPFALSGADDNGNYMNIVPSTALKSDRHQVLLTVGYKF